MSFAGQPVGFGQWAGWSTWGSALGTPLTELLLCPFLEPGSEPSYQICKTILTDHPLGSKMALSPIQMAQSSERELTCPASPGDRCIAAFKGEWEALGCDNTILNTMCLARAYGISTMALGIKGKRPGDYVAPEDFWKCDVFFNVFDPLNTSGSLVLNQNPNAEDFMRPQQVRVSGETWHRSRTVVMMNEAPVYIAYTTSAFGFVGRSVYQRALYPLKTFVQSMITDDMVTQKAGVLIAKIKAPGSIIDNIMASLAGIKRSWLQGSTTGNVLTVGHEDDITSLNLQNIDGAAGWARKNVLENIAVAADMPAMLLNSETFAQGLAEGSEDAKTIAKYIDRVRIQMRPLYQFCDHLTMRRAWSPEFYKTIQKDFPDEYGGVSYNEAFYRWQTSFKAPWPSLLKEPESELIKVDDVKLKAMLALVEIFLPEMDPDNKATLLSWAADSINQIARLFPETLILDYEALAAYVPPVAALGEDAGGAKEPGEPKPFARAA
jgi:hypothetical protein